MQVPGALSLTFLLVLFVLWPMAAIKSARTLRAAREAKGTSPAPSRTTIWTSTLVTQVSLLLFAWWVGRDFDYDVFALPVFGLREYLAAFGALAFLLVLRAVVRATRSEDERRKLVIYAILPRTSRDWTLWCAVVLVASVGEEAAYRGVAMQSLWWSLGNPWISAILVALAFAAAHWIQGWKSMALIFVISLVMQGLVTYTQTLVLAMVIHAFYDFIVGVHLGIEAKRFDAASLRP